ncbi:MULTISPECIES: hypothetical protein [Bacillaceae]|uniref:HPr family phosphocarrier protein n=1 Tax=Metabacillus sediminis TaxID=3117746 RepID=A0ABZ2NLH7_9BACI|nr:hypothetical protein [Bacillus sp. SJS]KZZ84620.1 hypothetical protein AS29_009775 [Bacillus sp. SJS]
MEKATYFVGSSLNMEQAIELNQLAKTLNTDIYINADERSKVDVSKLPSLVAFLLTASHNKQLQIICDRDKYAQVSEKLAELFEKENTALLSPLH